MTILGSGVYDIVRERLLDAGEGVRPRSELSRFDDLTNFVKKLGAMCGVPE